MHADLVRGLRDPETGRKGRMSAEQTFKVLLLKQMNGFSYQVLAYHPADHEAAVSGRELTRLFAAIGVW